MSNEANKVVQDDRVVTVITLTSIVDIDVYYLSDPGLLPPDLLESVKMPLRLFYRR